MLAGKHDIFLSSCQLILLIALARGGRPSAQYNWVFFIPIFIICIYSMSCCESDFIHIFAFICLIPTASDYILLRNSQPELGRIGQKESPSETSFKERLMWAASLLATPRGIGWAHEPTDHIPPRPTSSQGKFIVSQLLWIVFYFTLFNVTVILAGENPCFRAGGPSLAAFRWWWRTTSWLFIFSLYYAVSGLYATASVVSVATGLFKPGDCPHIFGSPLDAYTLRKCWGYVPSYKNFLFFHPSSQIGQSRLAPSASQTPHKQHKLSCKSPPSPKRNIYDPLQALHKLFHIWAYPRHRRVHTFPELL